MTDTNDQVSEAQLSEDVSEETVTQDELSQLKRRADVLGLKYHPSIGLDTLKQKVSAVLDSEQPAPATDPVVEPVIETAVETAPAPVAPAVPVMSAAAKVRKDLRDDALRLIRLRITNLNPSKKELQGEILTVANDVIGIVKKFVPYGEVTEQGFHVPNVLYKQLKGRKFLSVKVRKNPRDPNNDIVEQRWVPEFALEVLPQLTSEELAELARVQAASGSMND